MSSNSDLLNLITSLERERGIPREILLDAIKDSLVRAAQKSVMTSHDVRVEINLSGKGELFQIYQSLIVSDDVKGSGFISSRRARLYKPDAKPGDAVEVAIQAAEFGRVAAQTAKQAIAQKLREAERNIVFSEYKDAIDHIVTGTVKSFDRRDIVVDLGRAEAVLPADEQVPGDTYNVGDPIRALLRDPSTRKPRAGRADPLAGSSFYLTRRDPEFVKALFAQESAEISDGTVKIVAIARDAGFRTKIAVASDNPAVDPVGACVGVRGSRVKAVHAELRNEMLDIIMYSDDKETYLRNALDSFDLLDIDIVPAEETGRMQDTVTVTVSAEDYSKIVGRRGKNAALTAKLLGITLKFVKPKPEPTFEEKLRIAAESLVAELGITLDDANGLIAGGISTVDGILDEENDILRNEAFAPALAQKVWVAARALRGEPTVLPDDVAPVSEDAEPPAPADESAPAPEA